MKDERTRVLIPISESIGGQMSAVGIRQLEIGRALARHCVVTFAAAAEINDTPPGTIVAPCRTRAHFRELLATHDVLYTLGLLADRFLDVMTSQIRIVLDLYTPLAFEIMECWPEVPNAVMEPMHRRSVRWTLSQLARADFIVCASEPQRDLWLGMMNAAGLLSVAESRRDPAWRERIAVVPFGVPEEKPRPNGHPLRERLPLGSQEDFVLVWSSKLLTWQDPVTLIKAMSILREQEPTVRLVFLGIGEPRPSNGSLYDNITLPTTQARSAAEELGLTDKTIFFLNDRIPYRAIGAYYRDANAAVATYPDSLETRICLGTRLFDYLWARLPMVVSGGQLQKDFVEGQGLGIVVRPNDAAGLATAITQIKRDVESRVIAHSAFEQACEQLQWSKVTAPIVRYCETAHGDARRPAWQRYSAILPLIEFVIRSIWCRVIAYIHGIR